MGSKPIRPTGRRSSTPFWLRCPPALLAQLVEQWTFNPLVAGSSPAGGTMKNETVKQITDLVDKAINDISGRKLISTEEMTDLLLDIRLHIMLDTESSKELTL